MKRAFFQRSVLFALFVISGLPAFCQIDLLTNSDRHPTAGAAKFKTNPSAHPRQLPVSFCSDSTFWAIDSADIVEFAFTQSGIIMNGIVINSDPYLSLAYCNNLNGGTFGPTFYSSLSIDIFTQASSYYDSIQWVNAPATPDTFFALINNGGNGNYLYYEAIDSVTRIVRYNGSSFSTIYTLPPSRKLGVADIAVFDNGNFIIVTGPTYVNSDSLLIISPSGQVVNEYHFAINCYNSYGSFLKNDVYYIGIGAGNTIHPNTLLPVSFAGASIVVSTPLPMPAGINFNDLASCNHASGVQPPPPVAAFSSIGAACVNSCLDFKNLSQNADHYLWSFPGATTFSDTATNPTGICYDSVGVFPVTLIAYGPSGNDTLTLDSNVIIFPLPSKPSLTLQGDTLRASSGYVSYTWYLNGDSIDQTTDSVFIADTSGAYSVAVFDSLGCRAISDTLIFNYTGIGNFALPGLAKVFPNPLFSGSWSLVVSNSLIGGKAEVYDNNGRKIYQFIITAEHSVLDLDLPKGIYFLHISSMNSVIVKKLVRL